MRHPGRGALLSAGGPAHLPGKTQRKRGISNGYRHVLHPTLR